MIPEHILNIAHTLESHGFEAYLVGGALRNLLMGFPAKDFDLATNALPEEVGKIFPQSIMTNAKFGTVLVMTNTNEGELESVEITTYRVEKEYVGGRWPSHVEFTPNIADDLKRRDYTVNAIALKLESESLANIKKVEDLKNSNLLLDLFGGLQDIETKTLRAVGNPLDRFREDGLRPLRGCRIASVYGFEFEQKTFDAIHLALDVAAQVSMERVRDEFLEILEKSRKPSIGIELMRKSGLLKLYIPELLEGYGMPQNKYHMYDVYEHSLRTVDIAPVEVRLAALFHDIGKPRCKNGEHFYGHDREGAEMTRKIMQRLKFSKKEIEDTVNLVRWHMFYVPRSIPRKNENQNQDKLIDYIREKEERNRQFKLGWSDNAIRRMIMRVGGHEQIDKLIKLRIADALANPKSSFDPTDIQILAERVARIREQESVLSIKDLKINGDDLIKLGFSQGLEIRKALEYLLEKVVDKIELNNYEDLKRLSKEYLLELRKKKN